MAAGRVLTGFSLPWVAQYAESSGTVTYSNAMQLARGVSVKVNPESSDDNNFYADNQAAESASGVFTGGTVELVVDGLFDAASRLIYGLPEAATDGWIHEGDSASAPYVGIGFIARYMSDGVVSYVPYVMTKTLFKTSGLEAATQEEEIEWQTQTLEATLFRDDTANHDWRLIGSAYTTEALALAEIQELFNVTTASTENVTQGE